MAIIIGVVLVLLFALHLTKETPRKSAEDELGAALARFLKSRK